VEKDFKKGDYSKYKMCENCSEEMEFNKKSSKITKLKILITNHHLLDYTGSEVLTLTLAENLQIYGHEIVVYSKFIDKMRSNFEKLSIRLVNDLAELENENFDIAHVHHSISLIEVRKYFPTIPIVFYSQGVLPFLENPPLFELGVGKYIALSQEIKDNLVSQGISEDKIEIIRNIVDPEKFSSAKSINSIPQNALVISSRIDEVRENIIREACRTKNISLSFLGGRFGEVSQEILREYIGNSDIVFSLGRGAIEAMMAGRAVIIFDYLGGDGMVTSDSFEEVSKNNFSGRKYGLNYNVSELVNEIDKYNYADILKVQQMAVNNFSAKDAVMKLTKIYNLVIENFLKNGVPDVNHDLINFISNTITETFNYAQETGLRKGLKTMDESALNSQIELAEEFIEKSNYKVATDIIIEILKKDNFHLNALNDLAVIKILENNYDEAVKILKSVLAIDTSNESALANLQYIQHILEPIEANNNQFQSHYSEEDQFEDITCPYCNSSEADLYRRSADIVKCRNCDTVYLRHRFKKEIMYQIYQSYADKGSHMALPDTNEEIKKSGLRREYWLKEILEFTKPNGFLLDIGCGWGAFLDNARDNGFTPQGIEMTKKCVNYANNKLKIKVTNDQFEDTPFQENSINVVTMNHVFEHLPSPLAALKKIHTILVDDGLFCGIVPNIESFVSKNLTENWFWLDPNYHYVHYSPSTLKKHFENNGFLIERIYTTSGDYGKQNVLNEIKKNCNVQDEAEIMLDQIENDLMGEEIRFIARKVSLNRENS
jgi:2-polyprenyl-3-methyl-5-hydroxy-6-metoxy-1,4-benzoquinol methylase/glycosyltransferase involved in cell wall biosynthesis